MLAGTQTCEHNSYNCTCRYIIHASTSLTVYLIQFLEEFVRSIGNTPASSPVANFQKRWEDIQRQVFKYASVETRKPVKDLWRRYSETEDLEDGNEGMYKF